MYKRKGKAYALSIGVWRSLVARLNGVQEAASSILVTPTKKEQGFHPAFLCWSEIDLRPLQTPFNIYYGVTERLRSNFLGRRKKF